MDNMQWWLGVVQACAPILIALVGIIPTLISSRKKTQESIDELDKKLDAHIKTEEDDKMRQARLRIIRFNDELVEGRPHSESYFEDILDDVDTYEAYCSAHSDFKNNRGGAAMKNVKEVYEKVKRKGGFLIQKEVS